MDVLAEAPLGDPGAPVLEGYTDLLGGVVVSATPRKSFMWRWLPSSAFSASAR